MKPHLILLVNIRILLPLNCMHFPNRWRTRFLLNPPKQEPVKGGCIKFLGLLSGELDEQELKLMDDTTKKDIKRFITRPHWDGSWKTLHIYMRKWKFYMSYWGRFLSPVLKALTFISCLPDEHAELYLELMHELNWTYQDMYFELLDEARECADESFVEDEWEELTPSSGDYRSYRKWYLQWRVLPARVGECTASHAKKFYMQH